MGEPVVSIIIPVYQAEEYLLECLWSVQTQTYRNLEILLVDDGSTDGSPVICEECARTDARIHVIHQKNQGCSAARNTGIREAKGTYLLFLDADDLLDDRRAVQHLAEQAERTKADIVVGNYRRLYQDGHTVEKKHHLEGENPKSISFRFKGFVQYGNLAYDWGKLYRKDFLFANQLLVPSYSYAEDKAHNFFCCVCDPVYAWISDSVVLYRENLTSVTFQKKKKLKEDWILIAKDLEDFLKIRKIQRDYGDLILFHLVQGALFVAKEEMVYGEERIGSIAETLRQYGEDPYVKKKMRSSWCWKKIRKIPSGLWKVVTLFLPLLFRIRAYHITAAILLLMRRCGIDSL